MSSVEVQSTTINSSYSSTDQGKSRTNKSKPLVDKIRSTVMEIYSSEPETFDPIDIERVKTDDWYIKRFLLSQSKNVKSATNMLIDSLKWRKSYGVNQLDLRSFPCEIYRLGAFFVYEHDKQGREVLYVRANLFRRSKDLRPVLVQYGVTIGCQVEKASKNGVTCVIDFKNLSLAHVDLEIMRIIITTIVNHFPLFVQQFLVCNIPSVLQMISSLVINLIPSSGRNTLTFVKPEDLTKYIDSDKIPDCLGGTCKKPWKGSGVVPNGCPNFLEFAKQIGWTNQQYRSIYKTFKSIFESEGIEPMPEPVD
ncbi:motile sperm domain-containing protein 2-like [Panonychus citri]|uniref:motile sperm domain-containing protein 2-like n=1 Tax=Panonychus citri TaxID=50023 RepID=UPI0023077BCB|nr:motile sperm domain-containing protein 2-like [Panonychus citri]